ncbi:MAG: sulfotransferase domain-containing protein [Rhizobiaceae bacterium]|nr:sulfotransferase domain-containing protein [Rhizobiaceae bacterium]
MIAADANAPKGIVWIASYPKSGNTWIRIFLHHIIRIKRGLPAGENEIDRIADSSPSIAGQVDAFTKFMRKPVAQANMHDVVLARPKVAEEMAHRANGVLPVKTHSVMGRVFDTPLINLGVSVGAIYIVRNPLDVVISLSDYMAKPIDATITSLGAHLNASPSTDLVAAEIWGSWSENVRSWTTNPPPVIKVVRYEDLLEDPIGSFTAIAEHMRIGAAPAEIAEAVTLSSFDELTKKEEKSGFVDRPDWIDRFFRVGRAGQWKEHLTPEQIDRIVADHREQMARFGYLPA